MQQQAQEQRNTKLLLQQAVDSRHPPPMTEAHCQQLVYQHVAWLQQRIQVDAPAFLLLGGPTGGVGGAAEASNTGAADGAGENVGSAAVAGAALVAAAAGATVEAVKDVEITAVELTAAQAKVLGEAKENRELKSVYQTKNTTGMIQRGS